MDKYLAYFRCSITTQLVFKFQFFVEYISQLIIVLVKIFLWEAVVSSSSSNIFNKSEIIAYFILASIVGQVTDVALNISYRIRTGEFSNDLIKPINPIGLEFVKLIAVKVITLIKYVPVIIILLVLYHNYMIWPRFNINNIILLIFGLIIAFYIQLAIENLSFWMTDTSAINYILVTVFGIFSGSLIPYKYLPNFIKTIFEFLPFNFFINAPVSGMMGQLSSDKYLFFLELGVFYILFLTCINFILFKKGIKKYTAAGG